MISPYVRRLRLAQELRDIRTEQKMTHETLAKRSGINRQMISKLENGHVSPDQDDVLQLLDALGVNGDRWTELVHIANEAASRGWWESNSKTIGERQAIFANLEAGSSKISEYSQALIPGLLQSEDFTRARVERGIQPVVPGSTSDGIIKGRAGRQRMIHRPGGPAYEVILDEFAVRRLATPVEVFRDQLSSLAETATSDDQITIRVLPVDALIDGFNIPVCSFSVYEYPDPNDPVVVGIESVTTDLVLTDRDQTAAYVQMYEALRSAALSVEDSIKFLTKAVETLSANRK